MSINPYPTETLGEDDDNGTMPTSVDSLASAVVGHRIVSVDKSSHYRDEYGRSFETAITLDNGKSVWLADTDDCCAYTTLHSFLLHPERVDHVITGVGTTGEYTVWHIYADAGDVMEMGVDWSCGNPFYYGYGFDIAVRDAA